MVNILFNYLIREIAIYRAISMTNHSLFLRGRWDSPHFPRKVLGFVKGSPKDLGSKKGPRVVILGVLNGWQLLEDLQSLKVSPQHTFLRDFGE